MAARASVSPLWRGFFAAGQPRADLSVDSVRWKRQSGSGTARSNKFLCHRDHCCTRNAAVPIGVTPHGVALCHRMPKSSSFGATTTPFLITSRGHIFRMKPRLSKAHVSSMTGLRPLHRQREAE
jgi:hypothetical protein